MNADRTSDIVIHNKTAGEIQTWFMNGTNRVGFNSVKEQATQQVITSTGSSSPSDQDGGVGRCGALDDTMLASSAS